MATRAGCDNAFAYFDILLSCTENSSAFVAPMLFCLSQKYDIWFEIEKYFFGEWEGVDAEEGQIGGVLPDVGAGQWLLFLLNI